MRRAIVATVALATAFIGSGGTVIASTTVGVFDSTTGSQATLPGLFVRGDDSANDVSVTYDAAPNRFSVVDAERTTRLRSGSSAARRCDRVGGHEVRCENPARSASGSSVVVRLRGGEDQLTVPSGFDVRIAVNGGLGNDDLAGGSGDDIFSGGGGADRIASGGGADTIYGAARDRIDAGPGDDAVVADSGRSESSIDCGPGDDRVYVDANDVTTLNCETVKVRPGP